ncbi:DUF262 domain-containing protein [Gillisia sp. M10.2A]|uniref:DUF262 domain-containing protein n=1 Tax=Gillisia lutea TaxID=2909668 RepID=A0ABS9EDS2_9FLAO|nr:DUF262 domain-containing protein [Gillisia lutea]MCF4101027.1 DUF262 domain-containing protein [Gillisia lutea]
MIDSFTLKQIADWQLDFSNSKVNLPSVQRGFVWKLKQIEDLWDSILRGYPIGSFLLSKTGNEYYLMDGQQRATSIFLGHFNPYHKSNTTKSWSIRENLPMVWIDLKPQQVSYSSKYLIRVTTNSHPWGFQASKNDSRLTVSDRRKALDLFLRHPDNKGGYTTFGNSTVYPYDSYYPLPLCFFLESQNVEEIISKADKYLPFYFSTKHGDFETKAEFIHLLNNQLNQEINEIRQVVQESLKITIHSNIITEQVLKEENETKDPTLFVRINSSGTSLTGDDLIYSIYKAIFPESKNLIEDIGFNFITPPKVLSHVSRMVASELDENNYVKKMNVRDFQRRLKNDHFRNKLNILIQNKTFKKLFANGFNILSLKNNTQFKGVMPPVIIKQFVRKNQDLFLFFIFWLHKNETSINEKLEIKIVAKLFTCSWFGYDNSRELWNDKVLEPKFWEEPLDDLMSWDSKDLLFLIDPEILYLYYLQPEVEKAFNKDQPGKWNIQENKIGTRITKFYQNKLDENQSDSISANEKFEKFISKLRGNKDLILFAQRDYINSTFSDYNQMNEIDDTNVPWDWDHIYPSEWVYRKSKCNRSIKDWNNCNGNFRAISLELNRSRGNLQSPKDIKEKKEQKFSFILQSDWKYWQKIDGRIWDDNTSNHFHAITTRMINIYEKFWNDLKLYEVLESD